LLQNIMMLVLSCAVVGLIFLFTVVIGDATAD
jgi:hypothetical protein